MTSIEHAKTKRKNAEDYTVAFRPMRRTRLIANSALLSGFILCIVVPIWTETYACGFLPGYLVFVTFVILGSPLWDYTKVIVSPNGIGLSCFGDTLFIFWQQVHRLEFRTRGGFQTWFIHRNHRNEGLDDDSWQLKFPKDGVVCGFKLMRWLDDRSDIEHFQSTPIGEAFRYYAPWLFEVEGGEKRKEGGDGIH